MIQYSETDGYEWKGKSPVGLQTARDLGRLLQIAYLEKH